MLEENETQKIAELKSGFTRQIEQWKEQLEPRKKVTFNVYNIYNTLKFKIVFFSRTKLIYQIINFLLLSATRCVV